MTSDQAGVALVTGAAGFVGRHLVSLLETATNWDVVGLSRSASRISQRTISIRCDLRDGEHVARVLDHYRPSVIFHLAAQSYVPKALADPAGTLSNNILGQVNLMEGLIASDLSPRVLIASSSEIYGAVEPADLPVTEDAPFRPGNPYAVSKATQDLLGYQYWSSSGMDIVRARAFNHSGPGQSERFVLSGFARQVAEAETGKVEPTILAGNLDAERDFLDVRDVVQAYLRIVDEGEPGDVYNVSSGIPRRVGDLLATLMEMSSVSLSTRSDPARMRPSDVPTIYGDSTKLKSRTGWAPTFSIDQTLQDTLDYWRDTL
ncbi:MAG: GDP-mannose 4,6-dehydratase [Thermomicrobiales bacterium]